MRKSVEELLSGSRNRPLPDPIRPYRKGDKYFSPDGVEITKEQFFSWGCGDMSKPLTMDIRGRGPGDISYAAWEGGKLPKGGFLK